jgi:hypothetical protein
MPYEMGLGSLGASTNLFKMKFRWVFTLEFTCEGIDYSYQAINAFSAARPKVEIEDREIFYLGQRIRVPGSSARYDPMELTVYDIAGNDNVMPLYVWLSNFFRLSDPYNGVVPKPDFFGTVTLELLDGCGNGVETWSLGMVWPQSVDFGDLDMSSGDVCKITMSLNYNWASMAIPDGLTDCSNTFVPPLCCACAVPSVSPPPTPPDDTLQLLDLIPAETGMGVPLPMGLVRSAPCEQWFPIKTPDLRQGQAYITGGICLISFLCSKALGVGGCLAGANSTNNQNIRDIYITTLNSRYTNCTVGGAIDAPVVEGNWITYTHSISGCCGN